MIGFRSFRFDRFPRRGKFGVDRLCKPLAELDALVHCRHEVAACLAYLDVLDPCEEVILGVVAWRLDCAGRQAKTDHHLKSSFQHFGG